MDKNYILYSIFATMSCSTVTVGNTVQITEGYNFACPEQYFEIPYSQETYLFSTQNPSFISPTTGDDFNYYEELVSFANKVLSGEVPVDEEIQRVIENNFWDML